MKRNVSLLCAVVLMFTMILGSTAVGMAATQPYAGQKINVLCVKDPFFEPLEKLLPEFTKATGINVVLEGTPYAGTREKIMLDLVSGAGTYDVISADIMWVGEFAEGKYLVELSDWIKRDDDEICSSDIPDPIWGIGEYKEKQYAVPISPYTKMLLYRKDLFESPQHKETFKKAYGYDLSPPETWEQFRDVAEYFTCDWDGDGKMNYGVAFNAKRGPAIVHMWAAYYLNFGGLWHKSYPGTPQSPVDFTPAFDSPEAIESLAFYKDLLEFAPPENTEFEWYDTGGAFWTGRVAMMVHWNVYASMASDPAQSKIVGKVGAAVPPASKPEYRKSALGGWGLSINGASRRRDAAWEFVKWATSAETQKRMAEVCTFDAVARLSVVADAELQEKYPWWSAYGDTLKVAEPYFRPKHAAYAKMEEILGLRLNQAMIGDLTPDEAMRRANSEMRDLLIERGYIKK
jgi:multiple sugar transport system substrate-binding protein